MLDYLHSNSVNDDLDINTIMIVPCGVFCFYIILFVFSVFITGYSSKRNEISLRFKLSGRKTCSSRGENRYCYSWISWIKSCGHMIPMQTQDMIYCYWLYICKSSSLISCSWIEGLQVLCINVYLLWLYASSSFIFHPPWHYATQMVWL